MKMTKGNTPAKTKGSAPSQKESTSRNVNTGFSNKGKVKNNAGGKIDGRKSVASKTA